MSKTSLLTIRAVLMKHRKSIYVFVFGLILAATPPASADWINLTGAQSAPNIAEIHVNDDHVRLELEIFVGDLEKFIDLLPDDWIKQAGIAPPPLEERLKRFSSETFQIIADDRRLPVRLELVEPRLRKERPNPFAGTINPVTGRPVPGPPEDKRVLFAKLVYPFENKPGSLTFIPPLDNRGVPAASIGFIAYHKNVPVVDYRFLSQQANLILDWKDAWYSKFKNKSLKRWQQSGIMTFLYIEPFEVRHETLVRVKDLEAWLNLELRSEEYIEADEFEPMKNKVGQFLLQHSRVKIDGQQLRPILDRTSFVKYTMTRTYFINQPERLPLNTAMIGVIVTYVTNQIPREVTVDWDLFSERIQKVPTSAIDPAGPFPSYVTPDDNVFVWKNFLKTYKMPTVAKLKVDESLLHLRLPVASLLCLLILVPVALQLRSRHKTGKPVRMQIGVIILLVAGMILLYPFLRVSIARPGVMVPELTDKEATVVLSSLLKNVYPSFDLREEEDVYDRLATSVNGDLLSDIYLQNRKSLVVTQAGGARARVKDVKIQDVEVKRLKDRPLALLFHSKWTAMGTVGHWGHIHTRKNLYDANITVEPVDGAWKITGLELLEEKRIDPYGKVVNGK
jgi:hypothetical protein